VKLYSTFGVHLALFVETERLLRLAEQLGFFAWYSSNDKPRRFNASSANSLVSSSVYGRNSGETWLAHPVSTETASSKKAAIGGFIVSVLTSGFEAMNTGYAGHPICRNQRSR